MAAFLALLPREQEGVKLSHAIEARHPSFRNERFAALAREAGVAVCLLDDEREAPEPDPEAGFVYARIKGTREEEPAGYSSAEIDAWAERARRWSAGGSRPVFLFVISGAKVRNPHAAQALIARIEESAAR